MLKRFVVLPGLNRTKRLSHAELRNFIGEVCAYANSEEAVERSEGECGEEIVVHVIAISEDFLTSQEYNYLTSADIFSPSNPGLRFALLGWWSHRKARTVHPQIPLSDWRYHLAQA